MTLIRWQFCYNLNYLEGVLIDTARKNSSVFQNFVEAKIKSLV